MKEALLSSDLHIAIPILREYDRIDKLIKTIEKQTYRKYHVYFCINQPEHWWDDENLILNCIDNQKTNEYIRQYAPFSYTIIDRFSKGKAWKMNKKGVGWARKTIYQEILRNAQKHDIIISLDADTDFGTTYFQVVSDSFSDIPEKLALSVPYYHPLTNDSHLNRQMLRYEIYLRSYFINLKLIDSPYAYTAIGSAMAFPVWAYEKIGGMKAYESGEDFYLMQKLRKMGEVNLCLDDCVFPSGRFSDRVPFGTGPAMILGSSGDWSKYPIFALDSFLKIQEFYRILPMLYRRDVNSPLDDFFQFQFNDKSLWQKLRTTSKSESQFIRKVHQKFDGLRILQFLKFDHKDKFVSDEESLRLLLRRCENIESTTLNIFSFDDTSVDSLNDIRDKLFKIEKYLRCQNKN